MSFTLKFAANISTMFTEAPCLLDRYKLAAQFGFTGVESQFLYDYNADALITEKDNSGLEQVLINSYPGDKKEDFGFALQSNDVFSSHLEKSLHLAKRLNCSRVHIIADYNKDNISHNDMEDIYLTNMRCAAEMCEKFNIVGLIEPICEQVKPNYFLSSFDKALEYVKHISSNNLKLLLDIYHLQMSRGNLTNFIEASLHEIGHIQISQAPSRYEPSSPGEINYKYVLEHLSRLGYRDWIGLEYFPSGSTISSLKWIEQYGYKLY